ncbi:MAG: hypothetical protein CR997_01915 [Acidobacteria bacterium]|nr:MAG: hypothetical protein CR997_01915 [Acidobacteriota bacterium]
MMHKLITLGLCIGLFFSINSFAQEQEKEHHEEIVVTAHRIETALDDVGSSTVVVTAKEIKEMNAATVAEVLNTVSGITTLSNGGPGKASSLLLRGFHSRHTLVFVDGVRINENTSGGFNLSEIPVDMIERIEVIKGAQSAVYGSDAMGGVVQIITKQRNKQGIGGSLEAQAGSRDHQKFSLNVNGKSGDVNYGVSYSKYSLGDYSIAPGDEEDPFESENFIGKVGVQLGDSKIDLMTRYSDNETDLDGGWGLPEEDDDREQNSKLSTTNLKWTHAFNSKLSHVFDASYHKQETVGKDDGFQSYKYENTSTQLHYQLNYQPTDSLTVVSGLAHDENTGQNEGFIEKQTISTTALHAELLWKFYEKGMLTLGARNDDHELFGNETTYRLSGNASLTDDLKLHGAFGTGFKAPTVNDLFWPESPWSTGNPDLNPETSEGYDLGLTWSRGNIKAIDLTFFSNDVKDLIVWAPDENYRYSPENIDEATLEGLEFRFQAQFASAVDFNLNYTYLKAEDSMGEQLPHRPENQAQIGLNWNVTSNFSFRTDFLYKGDRTENLAGVPTTMDSYTKVNLGLAYSLKERYRIALQVENATDEEYEEHIGYGIPGRYGYLILTATF